jgi:hypothetical protein
MLSAILLLGVVIAVFCVTKEPRTAGPHVAPLNSIVSLQCGGFVRKVSAKLQTWSEYQSKRGGMFGVGS